MSGEEQSVELRRGSPSRDASSEALLRSLRRRGVRVDEEQLRSARGVAEALALAALWLRQAQGAAASSLVRGVLELWRTSVLSPAAEEEVASPGGLPPGFHQGFRAASLDVRLALAREAAADPRFDAEDALELGRTLRGLLREAGRPAELEAVLAAWEILAPRAYRSEPALLGWRVECALGRPDGNVHSALLGLAGWRGHLVPLLKLAEWCLYRGRVEEALAGLSAAWPGVRDSPRLFGWDIENFAQRAIFTTLDVALLRQPALGEEWLREHLEPFGSLVPGWLERAQDCRVSEGAWSAAPESWPLLGAEQLHLEQQALVMSFEQELRTRHGWPLGRTQLLHPWLVVLLPQVPRGPRVAPAPSREPSALLLPAEWVLREWARVGSDSRYRHPHAEAAVASALLPWGRFLRRLGLISTQAHASWRGRVTRALARLPQQFSSADDAALEPEVRRALRGG
jgi:hypothetical protein